MHAGDPDVLWFFTMTNKYGNYTLENRIGREEYWAQLVIFIILSILIQVVGNIAVFAALVGGEGSFVINAFDYHWFSTRAHMVVPRLWGEALSRLRPFRLLSANPLLRADNALPGGGCR